MCWIQLAFAAVAAIGSIQKNREENKEKGKAQALLKIQNEQRADEISDAASVELNERAREARRERARARAAASEGGINLASGSFLAQLQSGLAQQDIASGLVVKNHNNQQAARHINFLQGMQSLKKKSGLGIAFEAIGAGISAFGGAGGGGSFMGSNPGKG